MLARSVLLLMLISMISACGPDDGPSGPETGKPIESGQPTPATEQAVSEASPSSEFLADSLHPIEMADPGRFRLEVADEIHEGDLGSCGWSLRTAEGHNQDRFAAAANWRSDDGRTMQLDLWRFVMHDEFFWNASHGHESERVQVRLRNDGGSVVDVQDSAVSEMRMTRTKPGASPRWRWGAGEPPAIRVSADGLQATAAGELHGSESDHGSPLIGSFTLAVHCAGD
jgi:hypothetical protein